MRSPFEKDGAIRVAKYISFFPEQARCQGFPLGSPAAGDDSDVQEKGLDIVSDTLRHSST